MMIIDCLKWIVILCTDNEWLVVSCVRLCAWCGRMNFSSNGLLWQLVPFPFLNQPNWFLCSHCHEIAKFRCFSRWYWFLIVHLYVHQKQELHDRDSSQPKEYNFPPKCVSPANSCDWTCARSAIGDDKSTAVLVPNILSQKKRTISSWVMFLLHCYWNQSITNPPIVVTELACVQRLATTNPPRF